jgi:extracellular factor (EF) 3-hydroxypalmitic acid methyl ester biosynthesis protein
LPKAISADSDLSAVIADIMEIKALEPVDEAKQNSIFCRTFHGLEVQGKLLRYNRLGATFEIYSPGLVLRASEVLSEFKIVLNTQAVYFGKAVVSNLMDVGEIQVCEVVLEDVGVIQPHTVGKFNDFLIQWQKNYKIRPEFKLIVADLRSLLAEFRLWTNQLELNIRSIPDGEREDIQNQTAEMLAPAALSAIDTLGDQFEQIADGLDLESRPSHINFTRHNLHSVLLCSPFAYRTFHKPLGYAGDYEMVNMILKSPYQGGSLFSKLVNAWFLNQLPAQGHRNRIVHLKEKLQEETLRARRQNRNLKVFNLGCGPATEVINFMAESDLSDNADFTLIDFNEETIQHSSELLAETKARFCRDTPIQMKKKSVQQILKEASRPGSSVGKYDFVYCAGLFDYLSDRICKQLMDLFYSSLAPGGLLLVTNVDGTRPFHNKLEFILDWNLIYRNGEQMKDLRPEGALAENLSVWSDLASVNVFLEVRKPNA